MNDFFKKKKKETNMGQAETSSRNMLECKQRNKTVLKTHLNTIIIIIASSLWACLWFSEAHRIVSTAGSPCCPSRPEWILPQRFYLKEKTSQEEKRQQMKVQKWFKEARVDELWVTVLLLPEEFPDFRSPLLRRVFVLGEVLLVVSRDHVEYRLRDNNFI